MTDVGQGAQECVQIPHRDECARVAGERQVLGGMKAHINVHLRGLWEGGQHLSL